jgi:hypothetical protein
MDTAKRVRLLAGGMIVAGILGAILALWILPKPTSSNGRAIHAHNIGADDRQSKALFQVTDRPNSLRVFERQREAWFPVDNSRTASAATAHHGLCFSQSAWGWSGIDPL